VDIAPEDLHQWLAMQVQLIAVQGSENAILTWPDSFDFYDRLLSERKSRAALPEDERSELSWAWDSWNRMIDPLEAGLLAVIAGGDGMGKTVYAESQAEHWARKARRVAFVHFELNRAVMLDRRAARHTGISRRELKAGPFNQQMITEWNRARKRLEAYDGQITYLHTPGWSMERVTEQLARLVDADECDVVVIDYLEKARPSSRQLKMYGTNHWQREADDVETVKTFAEASETPVVLLAQLSKTGKRQGIEQLDRTAIRGAGEKTEKANIVVLIDRKRDEEGYAPTVDVRVDKNTLGPTGNFQQVMDGEHFRVGDLLAESHAR
jgi:replicative DNA helicase